LLKGFVPTFLGFQPVAMSGSREYDRLGNYLGGSNPSLLSNEDMLMFCSLEGGYLVGENFYEKSDLSEEFPKSPSYDILLIY
jgi:hypothetical protein